MNTIQNYGMKNYQNVQNLLNNNEVKNNLMQQQSQVNFKSRLTVNECNYVGKEAKRYMQIIKDFMTKAKEQIHNHSVEEWQPYENQYGFPMGEIRVTKFFKGDKLIRESSKASDTYFYNDNNVSGSYTDFVRGYNVSVRNNKTGERIFFSS